MNFRIRWPDGAESLCYSPSRAVAQHLEAETSYSLLEFLVRSRAGLSAASERVRARYGVPCARALGQLAEIERISTRFVDRSDATVRVLGIDRVDAAAVHRDEPS